MVYKWCVVPQCTNTSISSPQKVFLSVPKDPNRRKKWLLLARRDPTSIVTNTNVFMCEDHFDLEKDVKNHMQLKMGFSQYILLTDDAIPTKFHCQNDSKVASSQGESRKRRRKTIVHHEETSSSEVSRINKGKPTVYHEGSSQIDDKMLQENFHFNPEDDACRKRWGNIRDQYKKHMNKRKTRCSQGSTIIKKYKYEDNLNFLLSHVQDRHTVTSNESDIDETSVHVTDHDETETVNADQPPVVSQSTCTDDPKPKKRKRPVNPQTAPSASHTLMEYIIRNNEKSKQDIHPVDAFFNGLAATVKHFSPHYQLLAKEKLFAVVHELERAQLPAETSSPMMSGTSTNTAVLDNNTSTYLSKSEDEEDDDDEESARYSLEQKLVSAVRVHEEAHNNQKQDDTRRYFNERFNIPSPKRATLQKWERILFSTGSLVSYSYGTPGTIEEALVKEEPEDL